MPELVRSFVQRSSIAAVLIAAWGSGCTDDSGKMEPPDPTDTEAPFVSSTTPELGATGVAANAKIHITFSEAMDPATVESAYSSSLLPLDKVSLEWTADQRVLTITPKEPLEYAEGRGVDPSSVEPLTYAITIGTEAADLAGNPLAEPLELSFATKRRLTATFEHYPDLTKAVRDQTVLPGVSLFVGDGAQGQRYHSYVTFDIATLPEGSEIESASFKGTQQAPSGLPYGLGPVIVQHLTFETMENIGAVPAISQPGTFSDNANLEAKFIEVTSQVRDDLANRAARNHRSQYRLQIETATDNDDVDDTAVFTKNTFQLTVKYIAD